jgi:histidyl-tRNA synthetase
VLAVSKAIQAVRGMNDVLPDSIGHWQHVERIARDLLHAYGYREIRFPLLEKTELYARSIGELTDIVEKEMYTFEDRNGDSLTLRPEGTAGCVRAGIEHGLLHNQQQRLWYLGPMFRHERPQKGRYRQFHQFGVEALGIPGPDVDAELVLLSARWWRALNLDGLTLEINSLGTPSVRAAYRENLVAYFESRRGELDEDSLRRLHRNPMRVLDSKNPAMQDVVSGAPSLADALDNESRAHFDQLLELLAGANVSFVVNPRLVRGLDYYTRTVFEWTTDRLGAQSTVCAGGRYDGLVEQLGGRPTPAAGFAIGLERLIELLAIQGAASQPHQPELFVAVAQPTAQAAALQLAERMRDAGWRVTCHCGGSSLKSQLKQADRSGARLALLLGEDELARGQVQVKDLRGAGEQWSVAAGELDGFLRERLEQR